jgi:DNA-binding NarL/FixJ family response regulator
MAVAATFELVGREEELARLEGFVRDLSAGATGVVIRGEAGIGKTALWRTAVELAETAGVKVLSTRCAEAEMPLALGGVGDLIETALAEVAEELAEPQRRALAVAVGLEAPPDEAPDTTTLPRAILACLRTLAGRSPVLVAVDDVQWLDAPSQRILAFAARRLGDAPAGILVTQRGDAGDPLDLSHALEERFAEIRVGPLSVGALHHLIRTRLGLRIPRPTMARVHQASGGNPMFALEFAQVTPSAGGPLPMPSSLEELVRERVARLPPGILPLLATVAAVERPIPSLLEAVVDDAGALLDAASAAGAVTLGSEGIVRFTHPLLAAAAYATVTPGARRALHMRLAGGSSDPEQRARHLALATVEPDAEVARILDEAAAQARSRGAPDAAAALARHAIRLTPRDEVDGREERMLAVAGYFADAGQVADAASWLDELLAGAISGALRARALLIRFQVEADVEARGRTVEEALEHASAEVTLRARLLLLASLYQTERENIPASEALAREALAAAEEADDPALLSSALVAVTHRAALAGCPEPALLDRALALRDAHGGLPRSSPPRVLLAELRLSTGDLAGARGLLEAELETIRRGGREFERRPVLLDLVELELYAGNWERAERHLDEVSELVFDGGDRFWEGRVWLRRTLLAALRGQVDEARRLGRGGIAHGESIHWPASAARTRWALGFLELSLGEAERACELLADVVERSHLAPADTEVSAAIPDAVEALTTIGRLEEADALLAGFEARLRPDDSWATPAASRCRALLLLARAESEAALAAAEEAATDFATAGFPLDRGRALLAAGEALRRLGQRRRAAGKLDAAKQVFAELGAPLWVARAEKELRRARPRPRRDRELTNAERNVAALVAAGRTNREVAAELFTTVGTVEVHLTRIYRKLGLRSRTELARQVAEGTLDIADQ